MRIEHVAFMVADPAAMAAWYVRYLGCTIRRASATPPYGHFLADAGGQVMIEIYRNPKDPAGPVPDYRALDFTALHLAFSVADVAGERRRLLAAGASAEGEIVTTGGDQIASLRDPWGLALQLVRRARPMGDPG
jgi:catechol 2,3-dioxygenase-like lactoylglutathione lyase family enzyme